MQILEKSSGRELRRVSGRYSNFNASHHGNLIVKFVSLSILGSSDRGFKANIYNGKLGNVFLINMNIFDVNATVSTILYDPLLNQQANIDL